MSLGKQVVSSLKWTASTRLAGQLVNWAITLLVIRLLIPQDYGLMAMATVITAFFATVSEMGLGLAVIQSESIDRAKLRQVFGAVLLINLCIFAGLQLSAPFIASFYKEARLEDIIRVLAIQFLLMSANTIPNAMLQRDMQFKKLTLAEMTTSICGNTCVLIAAWQGLGVWSLVIGALLDNGLKAIALNILSPIRVLPSFHFTDTRKLFSFGGYVASSRVLWYFMAQSDVLIAGRMLGKDLLGYYSVSMYLASLPMQKIAVIINQVTFPAFARMQNQPELIAKQVIRALRMLGMVAFPVLWGMSSVAPELVSFILGEKWAQAVLPLTVLPFIIPLRMVSAFLSTTVQSVGRGDIDFWNTMTGVLVMPLAFFLGSQHGLEGLVLAWVIGVPVVFAINARRALPVIGITFSALAGALARPAFSAGLMYIAVLSTRAVLPTDTLLALKLALLCITGAVVYGLASLVTNREIINDMRRTLIG